MDERIFLEMLIANDMAVIDAKHCLWNAENNRNKFWENNIAFIAESPIFDEFMYVMQDGSLYQIHFDVDDWNVPRIKHLTFDHMIIKLEDSHVGD